MEDVKNKNENIEINCNTKYPILLIHGTGFRDDSPLYNYWGRIPKALAKRGAEIYYGRQDAWATIEDNAIIIKELLISLINERKIEKVNIIAHSKGGLEARYLVSSLKMHDRIASVTTIATPHHGSKTIDIICKIPRPIISIVSFFVNNILKLSGDKKPDFKKTLYQLGTVACRQFNENNRDIEGIYYQSYSAKMKNAFSDLLFFIPYSIIKFIEGDNDGLVSITSSQWGEWKGIIGNIKRRGVSHADVIDLRRSNFTGFDIRDVYINIVNHLKNSGL